MKNEIKYNGLKNCKVGWFCTWIMNMDMERDIILSYVNRVIMCMHCSVKTFCLYRIVYLQHCYCIINTFLINYCLIIIFPLIMHYTRPNIKKREHNVLFYIRTYRFATLCLYANTKLLTFGRIIMEIETVLCKIDFPMNSDDMIVLHQIYYGDFDVTNKPLPRIPRFVPCPRILTPQNRLRCL